MKKVIAWSALEIRAMTKIKLKIEIDQYKDKVKDRKRRKRGTQSKKL